MTTPKLGIDVGRVIMSGDGPDTKAILKAKTLEDVYATPATTGMWEAVKSLVYVFGSSNTFIVSKAGLDTACRTIVWMHHHDFFYKTLIRDTNLYFCKERADKTPICKSLGITHFIDDRVDVLDYMREVVPHRFQFLGDWEATEKAVLASLGKLEIR